VKTVTSCQVSREQRVLLRGAIRVQVTMVEAAFEAKVLTIDFLAELRERGARGACGARQRSAVDDLATKAGLVGFVGVLDRAGPGEIAATTTEPQVGATWSAAQDKNDRRLVDLVLGCES